MNLSIRDAAREHPEAPALLFDGETLTFGALAARVEKRVPALAKLNPLTPFPLLAEATVDALVTLYACIEAGIPVGLLSPRLPTEARAKQRARLERFRARAAEGDRRPLAFLFTSGTTGESKAVELSHAAFLAAAKGHTESHGWRPEDRWLLALSFAQVGGLSVLTRSLIARKPVAIFGDRPFEPTALVDAIDRTRATIVSLVPVQLVRLLEATQGPPAPLRTVLLGGAAANPGLLERAAAAGWSILPTYGMTETCAQVATGTPGVPLPGVELRIVEGFIEIRSPTLLTAYHADTGSDSPLKDGWFRAQDLGVLDGRGRLSVRGRADDLIITGGEKVNPLDVERVLEQIPGVSAACVVGLSDPSWGQLVVAALVANPTPSPELLYERMTKGLSRAQRPGRWLFVEALPRTSAGKLDRRATAELFSQPIVA